ncbi:MAG: MIP/aquaporin family protein [Candidatus Sumerlaeota bacterium]
MDTVPVRRQLWQRLLAEFIGTFTLVFAGCGAVMSNAHSGGIVSHVGVALAFGLALLTMINALGPVSAAHFNPAVTIGFCVAKKFPWKFMPAYAIAQCLGAITASGLQSVLWGASAKAVAFGATMPSDGVSMMNAAILEVIATFFLMMVVMGVATDKPAGSGVPGLSIGLTVTMCALFVGPMTGGSMNPARSIGPALFAGGDALKMIPLYIVAPIIGAALAAVVYEMMRDGTAHSQGAPGDIEEAIRLEHAA